MWGQHQMPDPSQLPIPCALSGECQASAIMQLWAFRISKVPVTGQGLPPQEESMPYLHNGTTMWGRTLLELDTHSLVSWHPPICHQQACPPTKPRGGTVRGRQAPRTGGRPAELLLLVSRHTASLREMDSSPWRHQEEWEEMLWPAVLGTGKAVCAKRREATICEFC